MSRIQSVELSSVADNTGYDAVWKDTVAMIGELPDPAPHVAAVAKIVSSNESYLYGRVEWANEADDMRLVVPNIMVQAPNDVIDELYTRIGWTMGDMQPGPMDCYEDSIGDNAPAQSRYPEMQRLLACQLLVATKEIRIVYGGVRTDALQKTEIYGPKPHYRRGIDYLAGLMVNLCGYCGHDAAPYRRLIQRAQLIQGYNDNEDIPSDWTWLTGRPIRRR